MKNGDHQSTIDADIRFEANVYAFSIQALTEMQKTLLIEGMNVPAFFFI